MLFAIKPSARFEDRTGSHSHGEWTGNYVCAFPLIAFVPCLKFIIGDPLHYTPPIGNLWHGPVAMNSSYIVSMVWN